MLCPTTWPVEKRASSTVNVSASRIARRARSRLVTSQPSSAGSHDTGSAARRRAWSGVRVAVQLLERGGGADREAHLPLGCRRLAHDRSSYRRLFACRNFL